MKKNAGFNLIEVMILLIVSTVLIIASIPVLSKKLVFQARNTNVIKCVQTENAADLTSTNCSATIKGSLYNRANYFDTLMMYVNDSNSTLSTAGLKVLREVCNEGGYKACDKITDRCINDINKCELASGYSLDYYLKLLPNSNNNMGAEYLITLLSAYYNTGISNIKTEVDKFCCGSYGLDLACMVKGTSYCSIPEKTWSYYYFSFNTNLLNSNDITADSNGNAVVALAAESGTKTVIKKFLPNGQEAWSRPIGGTRPARIKFDASGNVYVVGSVSGSHISLIKISSDGEVKWAYKYSGNGHETSGDVDFAIDNQYVYLIASYYNKLYLYKIKSTDGSVITSKMHVFSEDVAHFGQNTLRYGGSKAVLVGNNLYFAENYEFSDSTCLIFKTDKNLSVPSKVAVIPNILTSTGMVSNGDYLYISGFYDDNDSFMQDGAIMIVYQISTDKIINIYKYKYSNSNDKILMFSDIALDNNKIYAVGGLWHITSSSMVALMKIDPDNGDCNFFKKIQAAGSIDDPNPPVEGTGIAVNNNYYYISISRATTDATSYSYATNYAVKQLLTAGSDFSDNISKSLKSTASVQYKDSTIFSTPVNIIYTSVPLSITGTIFQTGQPAYLYYLD